jgi:hypothetical protein
VREKHGARGREAPPRRQAYEAGSLAQRRLLGAEGAASVRKPEDDGSTRPRRRRSLRGGSQFEHSDGLHPCGLQPGWVSVITMLGWQHGREAIYTSK